LTYPKNTEKGETLRILRVIARLNIGGPAIQAVSLTGELQGNGYASLLACGRVEPYEGDMSYLADERGVQPVEIAGLGREISPGDDVRVLFELIRLAGNFRPHVIHTHTAKAGTLGRAAGVVYNLFRRRKNRAALIHTFHGHVFHSYFGGAKTFVFLTIERVLAWFTDRIVVISRSQQADICEKFRICNQKKVAVIPLGFDLSRFSEKSPEARAKRNEFLRGEEDEGIFLVGIVGRLAPVKNHRMFLEALRHLQDQRRIGLLRFVVVGDGELREEIERNILAAGLEEKVYCAGWQRDMPEVYGALDAVVLTSLNEGTPVSLIEAMAAARAVISTSVGGVPDLMGEFVAEPVPGIQRHERGCLIPSRDSRGLSEALIYLLENPADAAAMGCRAREFVLAAYGLERLVKDVKALYRGVMDSREHGL